MVYLHIPHMQEDGHLSPIDAKHYGFRLADVEDDRARRAYDRWDKTVNPEVAKKSYNCA